MLNTNLQIYINPLFTNSVIKVYVGQDAVSLFITKNEKEGSLTYSFFINCKQHLFRLIFGHHYQTFFKLIENLKFTKTKSKNMSK